MPSSIALGVRYLFPYAAGLKYVEEQFSKGNETLLGSGEELVYSARKTGPQSKNVSLENSEYMMRLEAQKGRTLTIIKPLAVVRQKEQSASPH